MRRLLLLAIVILLAITSGVSAKLELSGESVWKIGYGSRYYSTYGWKLGLGGFLLSQELRLDVKGEIIDGLYLEAHIDNTKGDLFQQLTVELDWKGLWAKGGNISFAPQNTILGRPKASLMGLAAGFDNELVSVYAAGGKASGAKGRRVFKGSTAQEAIEYTEGGPYMPTRGDSSLIGALEGLWQATSGAEFDPAFDKGGLVFEPSSPHGDLTSFLEANSLGALVYGPGNLNGTLVPGEFLVSSGVDGLSGVSGAYIILRDMPAGIVRAALLELIRQYNEALGLTGDAALKYPYIAGSGTDAEFLGGLLDGWTYFATASRATEAVISQIPYENFARGLIYPLGFTSILADTLDVTAVSRSGAEIPLISLAGANWLCYEDRGYLELTLPSDFMDNFTLVRAKYSYRLTQGLYFLGGGIVRGSVYASLDGRVLSAGVDYEVDYEMGILMLLISIKETDEGVLEVDYEYETPGSKAWVAGAGVTYRPTDELEVAVEYSYASDTPYLAEDETTISRERSFDHIVAAWAKWKMVEGLSLTAGASFSSSAFPGNMALRSNAYNYIRDIAKLEDNAGGEWWAFAHSGGISVLSPYSSAWTELSMPASFAGTAVNAAICNSGIWYFATDSGIASLDADYTGYGAEFADVSSLWKTAGTKDGLQSSKTSSMAILSGMIYIGTPVGLIEAPLELDGPWTLYRASEHPELGDGAIYGLAPLPSGIVIASGETISFFDGLAFTQILAEGAVSAEPAELDGGPSAVLATGNGAIIVSTSLSYLRAGSGRSLHSASGFGSFIYYAADEGLFAYDLAGDEEIALYSEKPMNATACDGLTVYAGGFADEAYDIPIVTLDYPLGEEIVIGVDEHGINGRDRRHYLPKEISENTLYGAGGYLSLDYASDKLSGSASLKARGEGSIAGAGPGKPDSASATLSLGWKPSGSLSFNFLESFEAGKVFTFAKGLRPMVLSNTLQIGMGWKGPLSISLLASYNVSDGIGDGAAPLSQAVGGSAGLQYSIGGLRLVGGLSAAYRATEGFEPNASAAATASAYLQAGKNTSITLSYSEPTPFGNLLAPSSNYRSLAGSIRYSAYMTYGSLLVTSRAGYKWDVRNIADTADFSASLVYAARQMKFGDFNFIPRTELTLSYTMPQGADSRVFAYAKLSSGISLGIFGVDSSFSHKLTYMIESQRLTNAGEAGLTAYLTIPGWNLRPSIQLGASYSFESSNFNTPTGSWKANAKLLLTSKGTVPNQASLSYAYGSKVNRHDIGLSDSFSFSALAGKMSIGAGMNASMGLNASDIASSSYKAAVNASVSYKFDNNWSGKLLGEVGLGSSTLSDTPKPLYGFELSVNLKF